MEEKYVKKGAKLWCEYGMILSELEVPKHRHIFLKEEEMANETDITEECIKGFGGCTSPYKIKAEEFKEMPIEHRQEMVLYELGGECKPRVRIPWQIEKKKVNLAYYEGLREKGWTICENGFGIISIIESGQEEEETREELEKRLEELEKAIDQYAEAKGLKEKAKEKLFASVVLWNGYSKGGTTWEAKSDPDTRRFCGELKKENPSLFNYFERKIKIKDRRGEEVDVTYMAGIYQGLKEKGDIWKGVGVEMLLDRSMYNGYLEACNAYTTKGEESVLEFCKNYGKEEEKETRYERYANLPKEEMRELFDPFYAEDMAAYEKGDEIEKNLILERTAIAEQFQLEIGDEEEAKELAKIFIERLKEEIGR